MLENIVLSNLVGKSHHLCPLRTSQESGIASFRVCAFDRVVLLVGWIGWPSLCTGIVCQRLKHQKTLHTISDELMLDGNPRLNLASFVTTWMEPECDKLILSALNKNYIDMDEYPITTEFQVLSSGSLNPTITEDMGNQ